MTGSIYKEEEMADPLGNFVPEFIENEVEGCVNLPSEIIVQSLHDVLIKYETTTCGFNEDARNKIWCPSVVYTLIFCYSYDY